MTTPSDTDRAEPWPLLLAGGDGLRGVRWSDWGHPRRLLATFAELGVEPDWADRASLETT